MQHVVRLGPKPQRWGRTPTNKTGKFKLKKHNNDKTHSVVVCFEVVDEYLYFE